MSNSTPSKFGPPLGNQNRLTHGVTTRASRTLRTDRHAFYVECAKLLQSCREKETHVKKALGANLSAPYTKGDV